MRCGIQRLQHNPVTFRHHGAKHTIIQRVKQCMLRISIKKGKKETTYTMLHEYPKMWNISLSNNIGRLSQGIVDVVGNNTTAFIPHHLVQKGKSGIHKHGM